MCIISYQKYAVVIFVQIICVVINVSNSINYITCFCDWQILDYRKTENYHIMGKELVNLIYLKVFVEQ